MHHKIYSITILAICWIAILCHPLQSKVTSIDNQYADWNNSMTYLYKHPGYSSYEPVADIKKYGCNWGTWVTFPQKIEAIQAQVGKIRTTLDLLRSKDFLAMYKHPTYYVEAFLDYIADDRYTLSQKKIAIYATVHCPSICWKRVYELYEKKKIDLDTLALVLRIGITNHWYPLSFSPEVKGYRPYGSYILWLQNLVQNLPNDSDFSKELAGIFSKGELPNAWREYAIHLHRFCEGHIVIDHPSHNYYVQRFPFYATLSDAVTDIHYLPGYSFNDSNKLLDFDRDPYFLMAMEHPADYYPVDLAKLKSTPCNPNGTQEPSLKEYANGINLLCDKCYTDEEKSMAIFGMSQLGLTSSDQSSYYAFFLENGTVWYKQGALSVHHLSQLFQCAFDTFYKYPFFILDYKRKDIQKALEKFIREPIIPEDIKILARKVKSGTLATKEEMKYMEGYRIFRQTHFTLYETVVPRG